MYLPHPPSLADVNIVVFIVVLLPGDSFLASCTTTSHSPPLCCHHCSNYILVTVSLSLVVIAHCVPSLLSPHAFSPLFVDCCFCTLFVHSLVVHCSFIIHCSFIAHSLFIVCSFLRSCHRALPLLLWSLSCCYHILDYFLIVVSLLLSSLSFALVLLILIAVPHHPCPYSLSSSCILVMCPHFFLLLCNLSLTLVLILLNIPCLPSLSSLLSLSL